MKPKMHLAFDFSYAHLDGRWRTPGSWMNRTFPSVDMYEDLARIAERGCIDMMFFGDGTGIPATWQGSEDVAARWGIQWPRHDMSPYITAMSRVSQHVGFGLTYASTFMHPFYVARLLNSLDHVTGGRMGFNVITSTRRADAANYGFDELMEHDARYDRMEEFIDVCKALWASVEPDAFVWDRESGMVCEPTKVHPIHHAGKFFKVRGPLTAVPSPQGRPVIIQAGGSPRGIRASAHVADHIFASTLSLDQKRKHRAELDKALVEEGRDPEKVGVVYTQMVFVAPTEAEAKARKEALLTMIPKEAVGAYLSHNSGYDFSKLPARFSLAEVNQAIIAKQGSQRTFVARLGAELGEDTIMTPDELFQHGLYFATGYDRADAGTPAQIADMLEEQFDGTGCRGGFMFSHPYTTPRDMMDTVDYLIPELQRRGRFRTQYESKLLRENLDAA
jgi:FMN-dependent oxidoreductase (nitrilotriacetate monooxygenase family)